MAGNKYNTEFKKVKPDSYKLEYNRNSKTNCHAYNETTIRLI